MFDFLVWFSRLRIWRCLAGLVAVSAVAQTAAPHRVVTDAGGGTLPGISQFELFRGGLYWWKSGASASEVGRREGTMAVNAAPGIREPLVSLSVVNRYQGQGYNFSVDGVVRDDHDIYYAANGYLRRKPLASTFTDALADSTRILVDRASGSPPRFELSPVAANGAVMLWRGRLWGSYASGGSFYIERPSGIPSLSSFSAAGGRVKRMEAIEVLQNNGSRLKDSLLVLTQDQLLYQFDLEPLNTTPVLLARNVWDFSVRQESSAGGGGIVITRSYTTAIYVAIGDLSSTRTTGRLLRISARDRSSSVAYDTQSLGQQVRGVAVTPDRIYLTVTPLRCGGAFGCSYDDGNAQILSRVSGAHSDFNFGVFGTIADRLTVGGPLEGFQLRSDRRWLYWITGDSIWRLPADAKPIERDIEVLGLEVVQTTQDFDNSTRLVANKPTVARAYARLSKDTTGVGRYALTASLAAYAGDVALPGSPIYSVNNPSITSQGNLGTLRVNLDNGFLFELPAAWIRKGRFRVTFTVNPGMGVPETGQNPLRNNVLGSGDIEVVQTGSPCLVLVPIHTAAPDYDPRDPAAGFGDILARAHSLLPVDHFRFVFKSGHLSQPVPRIRFTDFGFPYPTIDMEPFDVSGGFDDALTWLSLYSAFERDPRDCGDTHYLGTVHGLANTTAPGSTSVSLGLATRPESGVARNLVVKMELPGSVAGNPAWGEPRGGETLAHELGHNYTLRHIDQTMSPLSCGGGRPLRAGAYPLDACTIGIANAANLATELADRTTQWGFDPRTWSVIGPTNAADLMSYRSSTWLSKPSHDTLLDRIPGFEAPGAAARLAAQHGVAVPETVVLIHGSLDLRAQTAVLRPCYRLPSATFDPARVAASLNAAPGDHDWTVRWVGAAGATLAEVPLNWSPSEDGEGFRSGFVQFLADEPAAQQLQILKAGRVVAECRPNPGVPSLKVRAPSFDPASAQLSIDWVGSDPEGDPLVYTVQFSPDNGATWETLEVHVPGERFTTSTRLLAGGEQCRFRIVASDGFNAQVAQSDPIALPRHAPEVSWNGLQEGQRVPYGSRKEVTAVAYDAEDGSLASEKIEWALDGPVVVRSIGTRFELGNLPPGSYTLRVTATDSDQQTAQISAPFEVEALEIPTAAAPLLDGDCGDAAYAGAPLIRLALADGRHVHGRMVHADGALHACVSDLEFSTVVGSPANVGLRVDRRASVDGAPRPEDLPGFFVDEFGFTFQKLGESAAVSDAGFIAAVSRGDASWSAEWLIVDALLGGWDRRSPVALVHANPSAPETTKAWPPGASETAPETWAGSNLGTVPPAANRPPVAVARHRDVVVAGPGERVYLDGSGSFDPDGQGLRYTWTQIQGPDVTLDGSDSALPFFRVPNLESATSFGFRLVVDDGVLESAPSEVVVALVLQSEMPAPTGPAIDPTGKGGNGLAFSLLWPGAAGDRCRIQASADLVSWSDFAGATADYLGRLRFVGDAAGLFTHRFYRAVADPVVSVNPPGGALTFDGVDDFVEITHQPALNAFPMSVAAWVRTSRSGEVVDGIASKYVDGSFNGYGVFVYFGRIRAFYFGPPGSQVWGGGQGLDGGPIADGQWHHVAFTVDASGGRLWVDGVQKATQPWVGTPGPCTTTAPFQIGRYHTYPNGWLGTLDEVGLWNAALTPEEVQRLRVQPWSLVETPRPLALWHLDEQEGVTTLDASGNGYFGVLRQGPVWVETDLPGF